MNIKQAITPLRMIFWGGILCVLDFSISSSHSVNGHVRTGFRFDLLNDFVGMILITIAVVKLAKFRVDSSYRKQMLFVFICCLLGCVKSFFGHFIFPTSSVLTFLSSSTGIASLLAAILFATAMSNLASHHGMFNSESNWLFTRLLMFIFWCVPIGFSNMLAIAYLLTGNKFFFGIGILIIPVLLLMLVPLVHLFISTSKMRIEAEEFSSATLGKEAKPKPA